MRDHSLKILWISDIHFYTAYKGLQDDNTFAHYFQAFFDKAIFNHSQDAPIEYIIISGDLAQQGTKDDYCAFADIILNPLLKKFYEKKHLAHVPKVICIPGNHDVNWTNSKFLGEYIKVIMPKYNDVSRSDFLKDNVLEFKNLFADYTNFLRNETGKVEHGKYKDFFTFKKDRFIVSDDYIKDWLFGYLIDKQKGVIFILLNSAWFSLGDRFNQLFAQELTNDLSVGGVPVEQIKTILQKKDLITEYNNQISGINIFDTDKLQEIILDYPDYLVISCMHHPLNWLKWDEYYAYPESPELGRVNVKENNATKLSRIVSQSDMLLTSHEHVPLNFENEVVFKDTLHLRSGCFLFDNQKQGDLKLANGWFSILDINMETNVLFQTRFAYNESQGNWETLDNSEGHSLSKRNDKFQLTLVRAEKIKKKIKKAPSAQFIKSYIELNMYKKNVQVKQLNDKLDKAAFYEVIENGKKTLYILFTDVLWNVSDKNYLMAKLDSNLKNCSHAYHEIYFLVLDLLIDKTAINYYVDNGPKYDRAFLLQTLAKRGDTLFDMFRHTFFSRFEPRIKGSAKVGIDDNISQYVDLKFVNHIIPYWIFESLT